MRVPLIIVLSAVLAWSGTTNVRIYHQAVASPASVQSKQIGVNTTADANLGFKMWFGKDADGNVTQFLAKSKNALVLNLGADTCKVKAVYSARDTGLFKKADSAYIVGLKADRVKFGEIRADTMTATRVLTLTKNSGTYATSGMIWNDSAEASFENFTNGIRGTFNRSLFAQQQIVLDSNSTAETSLMGTDSMHTWYAGSDSLPANWFKKGKRLRFGIAGIYSSKSTSAGNFVMKILLNNTSVCSTATSALDVNVVNGTWRMDGAIVCRDTGTTGSVICVTNFIHQVESGATDEIHGASMFTLGTTINTKIKQRFDLKFRFTTADVDNKIRSIVFCLEEVH